MKKKILITGANGMIGSSIVRELNDKYELILLARHTDKIKPYLDESLIIRSSLGEVLEWEDALDGVYCVIHLAAAVHWAPKTKEEIDKFIQINSEQTKLLYDKCTKYRVQKFLFFSTNDVYEASEKLITEDTFINPKSIYGNSKLLAEQYLIEKSKESSTSVCIFRAASIYGENDKGSMKSLIGFCKKGIVPMIGNGENKKALLYLRDVVQAVEKYIENTDDLNSEIFNVSSGNFKYKDMIDDICIVFGYKPLRLYIPTWFCKHVASRIRPLKKLAVAGETKSVSNEKIKKLLGYKAKYNLKDGLSDSKEYYY